MYRDNRIHLDLGKLTHGIKNLNTDHNYDNLFSPAKDLLPERGVIGFYSKMENHEVMFDLQETAHYYQMQYALVPLVLANEKKYKYLVGYFPNGAATSKATEVDNKYRILTKFDSGVLVLERKD